MENEDQIKYKEHIEKAVPVLEDLKAFLDKHEDNGVISLYKINNIVRDENVKISNLKKYAKCEHKAGEEAYTGSDSHNDYYETKCIHCDKILSERKD